MAMPFTLEIQPLAELSSSITAETKTALSRFFSGNGLVQMEHVLKWHPYLSGKPVENWIPATNVIHFSYDSSIDSSDDSNFHELGSKDVIYQKIMHFFFQYFPNFTDRMILTKTLKNNKFIALLAKEPDGTLLVFSAVSYQSYNNNVVIYG